MFPETSSRETLRFEQNKTKVKLENRAEIPAITCNSGQYFAGNSELFPCFPFDVTVFAMLPAHGIWRETVSLLDVM